MSDYGPPRPGQPEDPRPQQAPVPPTGGYTEPEPAGGYTAPPPGDYPPAPPVDYPMSPPPLPPDYPAPPPLPADYAAPPPLPADYPAPPPLPPVAANYPASSAAAWEQPVSTTPAYSTPAAPPPYGPPGSAPYPPVGPSPSTRKGLKIGLIVGGVVLLVVLICCGLGIAALIAYEPEDPEPGALPSPRASATSVSPTPGPTAKVEFTKGDCVVNDGTEDDAQLRKVPCGPDTYEVLSVIPFTSDESKCDDDPVFAAPDHDSWYVHDNPVDLADFVLCMKAR